jgi:hypothetical protein
MLEAYYKYYALTSLQLLTSSKQYIFSEPGPFVAEITLSFCMAFFGG